MKIRNHKKTEYLFYPHKKSKLLKGEPYRFKRKQDLMRFLNNNFDESLNGEVCLDENSFYHISFQMSSHISQISIRLTSS